MEEDLLPLLEPPAAAPSVTLLAPGGPTLRARGSGYDREIAAGLRGQGWHVDVVLLDGNFPYPTAEEREQAARALAALPDNTLVLADGFAFGAMADEAEREAHRLKLVGLVHHPLAAETGLAADVAKAFADSERRALTATRGVVVTSYGTGRALAAYGVERERVAVVVPGTAPAELARGTRGLDGGTADPVELLCVATLVPRKGHEALFDVLGDLRHLSWHLTCVGSDTVDPATAAMLREQLDLAGLTELITLAGELDESALSQAYDRADLFVLLTRHEGYGMAVAEAVARGLPVVSTMAGAIPELVDSTSGAIVAMDDTAAVVAVLERLIADDAERARVAGGARARRDTLPRWEDSARAMAAALVKFAAKEPSQR